MQTRREFLAAGALASAATITGVGAPPTQKDFIWAGLFHMGVNMWSDQSVTSWGPYKEKEDLDLVCAADHVRFDEALWQQLTAKMVKAGLNMVILDLGEFLKYPSHPELAVTGSWDVARFQKELARLRAMGLEPIPKLNFSTAHDTWLKNYSRMVSTKKYYQVCADLIRDVCEIFGKPRFFHLGYDEETPQHQSKYAFSIVRQGELWWHDFLYIEGLVEKQGVRPWIWSDYIWKHKDEFVKRMPKSVLQSNWYYGKSFDVEALRKAKCPYVESYLELEKAGFDQVPCGSNWSCDENFGNTVAFARANIAPARLKGFLMAPWFFTVPKFGGKLNTAIDLVGRQIG